MANHDDLVVLFCEMVGASSEQVGLYPTTVCICLYAAID